MLEVDLAGLAGQSGELAETYRKNQQESLSAIIEAGAAAVTDESSAASRRTADAPVIASTRAKQGGWPGSSRPRGGSRLWYGWCAACCWPWRPRPCQDALRRIGKDAPHHRNGGGDRAFSQLHRVGIGGSGDSAADGEIPGRGGAAAGHGWYGGDPGAAGGMPDALFTAGRTISVSRRYLTGRRRRHTAGSRFGGG